MRLTADDGEALPAAVSAVLDRRLLGDSPRPLALALSGGGDSLALLHCADLWRRRTSRQLLVLTVDHGLRPESAQWTRACADSAARLGLPFRALKWQGPRPVTGLPAAARAARHGLLAEAARAAGARVLLMGHTADDVIETHAMRQAGSTTPDVREWSPSPSWPQGRGLFVLRPLLASRRAAIREWLTERGETWIDDPANEDDRFARSRARHEGPETSPEPDARTPLRIAAEVLESAPGLLAIPREVIRSADTHEAVRLLALMVVCAGGGDRIPASDSLTRALQAFRGAGEALVTLAGARLTTDGSLVCAAREAGESKRGGLIPLSLEPGAAAVWDGRFEFEAVRPGIEIHALAGRMARLPEHERRALNAIPAFARPGLPAIIDSQGVSCAALGLRRDVALRSLVLDRLRAAAGLVTREPV